MDEGNQPYMMNGTDDTIIVRHREYVAEVYSSATAGAFTVANYKLQPGNNELFEWLAPIANQYQVNSHDGRRDAKRPGGREAPTS